MLASLALLSVTLGTATPRLRELAGDRLFIGGAVNYGYAAGTCDSCSLDDATNYTALLEDFSILTPENAMKMPQIFVAQDTWNFSKADFLVDLAKAHGLTAVRGHNLVWVAHNPAWLVQTAAKGMSGEELDATMRAHIEAAAGHFKGQVYSWDVVNEGINNMPHLRRCPLPQWTCSLKTAGSQGSSVDWTLAGNDTVSYVEKAFRYAHAADPDAKLFFNEFDIHGETDKMAVVEAMLMDLLSRGVPVHGVGMQTHIDNSNPNKAFNETGFRNVLKRFAAIGVEIHISELNVKSTNDPIYKDCTTDDCKEKALADLYGQVLSACLDEPLCKSFELWGITDHHNSLHTGGGSMPIPGAFLYDDWYQPKPVRAKLADILSSRSQFARPIAV